MNHAYCAGIIDGEGSIGFSSTRNIYYPRVMVVNTNMELLEDFKSSFGGNIHRLSRAKKNWKVAYQWQIGNRACVNFLEKISDYLRLKQDQAYLIFAWDIIRPGIGHSWGKPEWEAMLMILAQIRWLNARGANAQMTMSPIDEELMFKGW